MVIELSKTEIRRERCRSCDAVEYTMLEWVD
jgi:hypothetical protein